MEPVNEMAAFIERYGDAVVPLNQKIQGVGSERRAGRLHTPHKGRGLSAARARSAETLYCPRQQQLLCSGLQKSHLQAAGDGAALQLQPGGPQQRGDTGQGICRRRLELRDGLRDGEGMPQREKRGGL